MSERDIYGGPPEGSMITVGTCVTAIARGLAVNKNTSTGAAEVATSGFCEGVTVNPFAAGEVVGAQAFGFARVKANALSANIAYKANMKLTTGGIFILADTAGDAVNAISYETTTQTANGVFILALISRFYKHA